jgi:hypothetical protein
MSVLHPTPVSTDRFTFSAAEGLFVAELSDLGRNFRFGQIYDDACDVGLTLVSAKSGREIVFAVEHEERDREGDLLWIDLAPVRGQSPGCWKVRLFND